MAIKKYKPTTPGRRGMTVTDYSVLSKVEPERSPRTPWGKPALGLKTRKHHARSDKFIVKRAKG